MTKQYVPNNFSPFEPDTEWKGLKIHIQGLSFWLHHILIFTEKNVLQILYFKLHQVCLLFTFHFHTMGAYPASHCLRNEGV